MPELRLAHERALTLDELFSVPCHFPDRNRLKWFTQTMLEAALGYRVLEEDAGYLDVFAGAR